MDEYGILRLFGDEYDLFTGGPSAFESQPSVLHNPCAGTPDVSTMNTNVDYTSRGNPSYSLNTYLSKCWDGDASRSLLNDTTEFIHFAASHHITWSHYKNDASRGLLCKHNKTVLAAVRATYRQGLHPYTSPYLSLFASLPTISISITFKLSVHLLPNYQQRQANQQGMTWSLIHMLRSNSLGNSL